MKSSVLFGDTFGSKADYSSGVFYAGRRKYLSSDTGAVDLAMLLPPKELRTRQQAQKIIRLEQQMPKVKAMNFEHARRPSELSLESLQRPKGRMQYQTRESLPMARFAPRTPSSKRHTERWQWEKEYEAGCWYWRNVVTGELTETCPFPDASEDERLLSPKVKRLIEAEKPIEDPESVCPVVPNSGTGAVVYDSQEYEDLLELLDSAPTTPAASPNKQSITK